MNIFSLIQFITTHPLNKNNKTKAVFRFLKWQMNTRLNPYPVIYPFTEKSVLIVEKGMTGATQNVYCGLHEFDDMSFLIHLLRKEDFFVDIGANIGSYTVLASAHVGAETVSIEPVPFTFSRLVKNISINQIHDKVSAFNVAAGAQKGSANFTSSLDTMNHIAKDNETNTIEVLVETLDDILRDFKAPLLLKIDVEGFETEVMKGACKTLGNDALKAIIIELNGSGSRYGYDESKIHENLLSFGFSPFNYHPQTRALTAVQTFGSHNTIYIRDLDFVKQRLKTSPKIKILNNEI